MVAEVVYATLRKTRLAWLRLHCLNLSFHGVKAPADETTTELILPFMPGCLSCPANVLERHGVPARHFKEANEEPTPTYRSIRAEFGIAYGTRVLWRRRPHSSQRQGKPATWRRGSGVVRNPPEGMCVMHRLSRLLWVLQDRGSRGLCLERCGSMLEKTVILLLTCPPVHRWNSSNGCSPDAANCAAWMDHVWSIRSTVLQTCDAVRGRNHPTGFG